VFAAEFSTALIRSSLFLMLMLLASLTHAAPTLSAGAVVPVVVRRSSASSPPPPWLRPCGRPSLPETVDSTPPPPPPPPVSRRHLQRLLRGVRVMAIRMMAIAEDIRISYVSSLCAAAAADFLVEPLARCEARLK